MTTKTREEAIEEIKTEIAGDVLNGSIVRNYEERSDFLRYQYWNKNQTMLDDPCTVIVEFAPPKPEFEKGTLGNFSNDDSSSVVHREFSRMCDTLYEDHTGTRWDNFTPIYQADPIEKRAFELACGKIGGEMGCARCTISKFCGDQKGNCYEVIQAYFKSRAKEELSK